MEIEFKDKKKANLFGNRKKLVQCYGDRMADKIEQRLEDLASCAHLKMAFSLPGRLHALCGDWAGHFAMDLVHPHRLVFRPANDPLPYLDEEQTQLDQKRIDIIRIVEVIDYH